MEQLERISDEYSVFVTEHHKITTDTLLLADFALPRAGEVCADLGCGCGAIALFWAARAKPARIYAAEIQPDICDMARRSVEHNGLSDLIEVMNCDLRELRGSVPELSMIACNPPYKPVGTGILCDDDGANTARHEFSCTLWDVASAAASLLKFGGRLCVCQRPERLCDAVDAFRAARIEPKRLRFVQQRPDKKPFLFLLEGRFGGKPYLTVEPTLFVEEKGDFSTEMMKIYGSFKTGHTVEEQHGDN